ncbi:MAG: hypothetical protein ABL982_18315 [Vicinamibacterales bacterium]
MHQPIEGAGCPALLRTTLDDRANGSTVDMFVRGRAGESLAHVFTLLSLVLPREPMQLAFRGLQTDDEHLRGTALEYLDTVLPPVIRQRLWPFLEHRAQRHRAGHNRDEAIASLLRSNQSIELNLEELPRRLTMPERLAPWGLTEAAPGAQG